MLTLAWMIETLLDECELMQASKDDLHVLAWQIVSARALELSDDETWILIDAGREEALTETSSLLVNGLVAAAGRALAREDWIEPDPATDDTDADDDVEAMLNVLAFGLVRLARDEDEQR